MTRQLYLIVREGDGSMMVTDDELIVIQAIENVKKGKLDSFGDKMKRRIFKLNSVEELDINKADFEITIKE